MSPIDDDMKEAIEWVNNHMSELSLTDQMKLAKASMNFVNLMNEMYKKNTINQNATHFYLSYRRCWVMEKQIKIELPDFCEGCEKFTLEHEEVHAINLDGTTINMNYYSCSNKDFCCYQYSRMTAGSSPKE